MFTTWLALRKCEVSRAMVPFMVIITKQLQWQTKRQIKFSATLRTNQTRCIIRCILYSSIRQAKNNLNWFKKLSITTDWCMLEEWVKTSSWKSHPILMMMNLATMLARRNLETKKMLIITKTSPVSLGQCQKKLKNIEDKWQQQKQILENRWWKFSNSNMFKKPIITMTNI